MTGLPDQHDQPRDCLVPLKADSEIPDRMHGVLAHDRRITGRVRDLTRAVASSTVTWQATTRAEQLYAMMRRLDVRTQTLACLYTSLLNGCLYCIDDAAGAALENGLPVPELLALRDLSATTLGEETAAKLRYARWVAMAPDSMPSGIVESLRKYADTEEILELTVAVSMKCFWNRFVSALSIPPEGRCKDGRVLEALCDISRALRADLQAEPGA